MPEGGKGRGEGGSGRREGGERNGFLARFTFFFGSLFRAERLSLLRLASYLPRIGTVPRSGPTANKGGGLVAVVGKEAKRK